MSDLYNYVFHGPPKVKGSLSILLNFSGTKACLIRVGSSRVVEVDWPTLTPPSTPNKLASPPPPTAAALKRLSEDLRGKGKMRSTSLSQRISGAVDLVTGRLAPEGWIGKALEIHVPSVGDLQGRGFYVLTKGRETGIWPVSTPLADLHRLVRHELTLRPASRLWQMPLPVPLTAPLHRVVWSQTPASVSYLLSPVNSASTLPTLSLVSSTVPGATFAAVQVHTIPLDPLFSLTPSQLQRVRSRSSADPDGEGIEVRRASHEMGEEVGFLESGSERGREEDGGRIGWGWDWRGGEDFRLVGLGAEGSSV